MALVDTLLHVVVIFHSDFKDPNPAVNRHDLLSVSILQSFAGEKNLDISMKNMITTGSSDVISDADMQ